MSDVLPAYRDDGPLAVALGHIRVAERTPVLSTVVMGVAALAAGLIADGRVTGAASATGAVAFVLLGAIRGAGAPRARLRWLVGPLLHAGEYATLVVLAWRAGMPPAAFALLAVVVLHHYEAASHRNSTRRSSPIDQLGGGWDGRTLILTLAAVTGVLPQTMVVAAVWCGLLFGGTALWTAARIARGTAATGGETSRTG